MPVIELNSPASAADEVPAFDLRTFRNAMGQFATGVVVISAEFEGHTHAMTANAFREDVEMCYQAGMDDFMSKPVTLNRLSQVLGKWLGVADHKKS